MKRIKQTHRAKTGGRFTVGITFVEAFKAKARTKPGSLGRESAPAR